PVYQPDEDRLFIPARLDDNEHLDRAQYRASLARLDPFTRSQLEAGDWSEYSGGLFKREGFTLVDYAPDDLEKKVRAWDSASTTPALGKDPDWTAGVLLARTRQKQFLVLDVKRIRATPLEVEQLVRRTAEHDGTSVPIYVEEEGGSAGKVV